MLPKVPLPTASRQGGTLCRQWLFLLDRYIRLQAQPHQLGGDFASAGATQPWRDDAERLEAELLQHPCRGRVVEEVRTFEVRQAERSRDVDQRSARFGRVAAAPEGPGDPIAHLDRAGGTAAETAGADQLRRSAGALKDEQRRQ